jgi:hypothetical protein
MDNPSSFTFVGYQDNISNGDITFSYELQTQGKVFSFRETLTFTPPKGTQKRAEQFKPFLDNIFLALGISYWKIYCPRRIVIQPFILSREQADFWNLVYTKGLGEFYYANHIDFRNLVQFPYSQVTTRVQEHFNPSERSLVLLGGGKDSIVTAEILRQHKKEFSLFTLNSVELQRRIGKLIGHDVLEMKRTIDPQLFQLNTSGNAYNGHVPISAIYAFISLFAAALYDYQYIIASNEVSANYGNVEYLGQEINHQWSKSFEFEQAFQSYVRQHITSDLKYFSLLRPIHEIEIVKLFTGYEKYFSAFSSCNRNFTQTNTMKGSRWCGVCPKCAFVFLLLSAFLPKVKVLEIFCKDLFAEESLLTTYKELLGFEGFKPFECVGTSEESLWAFKKILDGKEYNDDVVVKTLAHAVNGQAAKIETFESRIFSQSKIHAVPDEFSDVISSL